MSIVGLVKCREGILSFSDEKGTYVGQEDTRRGRIKKTFKNADIIFGTYGFNEVFTDNIETYCEAIVKNATDTHTFISQFEEVLNREKDTKHFTFILYEKKCDKLFFLHFENMKYIRFSKERNYAFAGNTIFVEVLKDFFDNQLKDYERQYNYDISIRDMRDRLAEILRVTSDFCDKVLSYNSVSKIINYDFMYY